jgi:GNAT superfamily N-acetyltransferase
MCTRDALIIVLLADYPHWIAWLAKSFFDQWHHLYPTSPYPEWEIRLRKNVHRQGLGTTLVGVLEGKPVASACLKQNDMTIRNELGPWLSAVWVQPEYRGRGFGTELVMAIEALARTSNIDRLYLWTPDRDRFYARLNWQYHEKIVYNGMLVHIMRKDVLEIKI